MKTLLVLVVIAIGTGAAVWYTTLPEPVEVLVARVERGPVRSTVANTRAGTVKTPRRAKVAPATSGQVTRLNVREGDRVQAGSVLLELWNDDLQAELQHVISQSEAAKARIEEIGLRAELAERESERQIELKKDDYSSVEDVDRAVTQARALRAAGRAAKADAKTAADRIAVVEAALDRTILKAPFDGIVAEVNAELGEIVAPSPPGIPTPPAVEMIAIEGLFVSAPIDEVDAPAVELGMKARISLDAFPGRVFAGEVSRIAPYVLEIEKQARTVEIEVDFVKAEDCAELLPGYSADAEIILDSRENTLRVPTEAILQGSRVLVFAEDRILVERHVEIGLSNWKFTEILSGLEEGEQVVLTANRPGVSAGVLAEIEPGRAEASVP